MVSTCYENWLNRLEVGRSFHSTRGSWPACIKASKRSSKRYSLAYESSAKRRDGKWRQIHVQVKRPGVTARTRQGYFAPAK